MCAKVCGIIKIVMPEIITRETLKNVSLWLSFPECGRLYPVLLSDQKEGALQTAVPKTELEEKTPGSSKFYLILLNIGG